MSWSICVAHCFGAAFLTNSIPHLVSGISGRAFQSPFASFWRKPEFGAGNAAVRRKAAELDFDRNFGRFLFVVEAVGFDVDQLESCNVAFFGDSHDVLLFLGAGF
jgi:hypothetical protein